MQPKFQILQNKKNIQIKQFYMQLFKHNIFKKIWNFGWKEGEGSTPTVKVLEGKLRKDFFKTINGERGSEGLKLPVKVLKGKLRKDFFETLFPLSQDSKGLAWQRFVNLTKVNNSEDKVESRNNKVETTALKKVEAPENADKSGDKGDDLAKAGNATVRKLSDIKTLSNDTSGKFRLSINGSIQIKSKKDEKPSLNLEDKPNDQEKGGESKMSQTLSQTKASNQTQASNQTLVSSFKDLDEKSDSLEEESGNDDLEEPGLISCNSN